VLQTRLPGQRATEGAADLPKPDSDLFRGEITSGVDMRNGVRVRYVEFRILHTQLTIEFAPGP